MLVSTVVVSGCWLSPNSNVSENVNTFPQTCGGIAGIICASGYECVYSNPSMPDGAGLCLPASDEAVNDNLANDNASQEPKTLTPCGGQSNATCPVGYTCQLPADVPADAQGVCLPDY